MKREQKVLSGLLTAILAGALVLAGCENPAGPKGDKGDPGGAASNAQKEQLAAYGFTFGNPVHNAIGRPDEYSTTIYSDASIDYKGTLNVSGAVVIVYGNKSRASVLFRGRIRTETRVKKHLLKVVIIPTHFL
ncbi:hypothetical protein FACS189494_04710 [Spirochaetia bacterium]|nr:hypothetical protein FACS189494_04710 [Spirochaetia bacterium]